MKIESARLILSLFLLFSALFLNAQLNEVNSELLKEAEKSYNQQNYESSKQLCSRIVRYSKSAEVYELLGYSQIALEEYENAKYSMMESISLRNEPDPSLYYLYASVLVKLKEFEDAIIEYQKAIVYFQKQTSEKEENPFFLEALGNNMRYLGNYIGAESKLKIAIRKGNALAYLGLISTYLQLNEIYKIENILNSLSESQVIDLKIDTVSSIFLENVSKLVSKRINIQNISELDYAINSYTDEKGFNGLENDLFYLKYKALWQINRQYDGYKALQQYVSNNPINSKGQEELSQVKMNLNIDSKPPEIEILNPLLTEFNSSVHSGNEDFIIVYGRVLDESGISNISVNDHPIINIENDGIFRVELELHPGRNDFNIKASDIEGNVSDGFSFVIHYEKNDVSAGTLDNISESDIPLLSKGVTNHAVFIAMNDYLDGNFRDLEKPIQDARDIKHILTGRYSFKEKNITELFNVNKKALLDSLTLISSKLGANDNLIVFYAGHGDVKYMNEIIQGGYIIPSDAEYNSPASYISSFELMSTIKKSSAKNILVMVDACFGGALNRSVNMSVAPAYIKRYNSQKSRYILTSGNIETVPDRGEFITNLKNFLGSNTESFITALDMYVYISKNTSGQNQPQFERIENSGDTGGMFVFFLDD